jgi:hypothetical protein
MSFIIVLGNSYAIKNELKERFRFQFDFNNKVWFKSTLQDKYWFYEQAIEALASDVNCAWVSDINNISEAKKLVREIQDAKPKAEVAPHELDGAVLEMSSWYAKQFKENQNTQYAFRNLKINKVIRETQKALQVDAEFFSGIASTCGVCGRELNNDISRATGIGPVCAAKIGLGRPTMAKAKEVVAELEKLSAAQGEFKEVWIPRSQIKNTIKKAA